MENLSFFEQFEALIGIGNENSSINYVQYVINLLLSAIFSFVLSLIFNKYGKTLSNKNNFSANFIIIGVTTTLIITIVKSSLALSLGLVGALSIVRFRTAIKEPEELAYIFLVIALGLGFGANMTEATIIGFLLIVIFILVKGSFKPSIRANTLLITIASYDPSKVKLEALSKIVEANADNVFLKRYDQNEQVIEVCYRLDVIAIENLQKLQAQITTLDPSISISVLDNKISAL